MTTQENTENKNINTAVYLYLLTDKQIKILQEDKHFHKLNYYEEFVNNPNTSYYITQELNNLKLVYINMKVDLFGKELRTDEIYFIGIHHIYKTKQYALRELIK